MMAAKHVFDLRVNYTTLCWRYAIWTLPQWRLGASVDAMRNGGRAAERRLSDFERRAKFFQQAQKLRTLDRRNIVGNGGTKYISG